MQSRTYFVLFLILLTTSVRAGGMSSGGGYAVVCRSNNEGIVNAELLDLYEAKNKYNYQLIESTGSLEGDYINSVRNTYRLQGAEDIELDDSIQKNLYSFFDRVIFLKKDEQLPNLDDLGEHLPPPPGCQISPLAVWFDDQNIIKIDSEIWNKLSTLDQAALVQHELSYHYERGLFDTNSEGARAFVRTIFSMNAPPVLNEFTEKLPMAMAISKDASSNKKIYTAFHYGMDGTIMRIFFTHMMNRPIVSEAIAEIDLRDIVLLPRSAEVIAITHGLKKIKTRVITDQRDDWEVEFTFVPGKVVKVGLYQKGILVNESSLAYMATWPNPAYPSATEGEKTVLKYILPGEYSNLGILFLIRILKTEDSEVPLLYLTYENKVVDLEYDIKEMIEKGPTGQEYRNKAISFCKKNPLHEFCSTGVIPQFKVALKSFISEKIDTNENNLGSDRFKYVSISLRFRYLYEIISPIKLPFQMPTVSRIDLHLDFWGINQTTMFLPKLSKVSLPYPGSGSNYYE